MALTKNVCIILPLLVLMSTTHSSYTPSDKVTKELVVHLCSKPRVYRYLCVTWLISDPKTFTLDLQGLLGMVMNKTQEFGYETIEMTKGLVNNATNPDLKMMYGSCLTDYELTTKEIEIAKRLESSKLYFEAGWLAFKAENATSDCQTMTEAQPTPPYFSRRVLMFENMCGICRALSFLLDEGI